jgi:mannose-1-phosphate guanylyltransferase
VVQAILLVGGQGTRLRPLTINTPKPMLPVAGHPCTSHQIARAKAAGIERIVLGTSYKAEVFETYFGNGTDFGIEIAYAVEDEPLGTGGAIRNAANLLTCAPDDPVVIFNGDVLTGLDIEALVENWRKTKADVAIYLTRVTDPRPYGLVPTDTTGRVLAFLEKPTTPEEIVTDQINAGCYVFRRSLIDQIPADRPVSVERETFPELLATGANVIGVVDDGYWLDLGTPLAFAQGSADLVQGIAPSPLLAGQTGQSFIAQGATIAPSAQLSDGTYVGAGATIESDAVVSGSVVFPGAKVGSAAKISGSIVGAGCVIGAGTVLQNALIADGATIGSGNELIDGARIWPNAQIADGVIRFSSDR